MTTRSRRQWPAGDLDLAAALRVQLDESTAKRVELDRVVMLRDERIAALQRQIAEGNAERDALRATLLGEAELAEAQHEPHDKRGSAWWMAAWREVSRYRAELLLRNDQLERWLKESGAEATKLQTQLEQARAEIGELTRRVAETEVDVVDANAARDDALDKLTRCECGADTVVVSEEVH